MVDPIGTTLGAVSLCMQLVDGIVQVYKFYLAAAGMPAQCTRLRTRLCIEYQRILSWTEEAGLLEAEKGQDLPVILRTNKLLLVDVLASIRALMDDFVELRGKYKELQDVNEEAREADRQIKLVGAFASISHREEKLEEKRKYLRGTNHIRHGASQTLEIAKHPRRLLWVAFDEEEFKGLLGELTECNNYLFELLQAQSARSLKDMNHKIYVEIVSVRSSVEQLKELFAAASLGYGLYKPIGDSKLHEAGNDILRTLADLKAANISNDPALTTAVDPETDGTQSSDGAVTSTTTSPLPSYHEAMKHTEIVATDVTYKVSQVKPASDGHSLRSLGTVTRGQEQRSVWIEWKAYDTQVDFATKKLGPRPDHVRRAKELIALLQLRKLEAFRVPVGAGFFDDREMPRSFPRLQRFGLAFEYPEWAQAGVQPQTLYDLLLMQKQVGSPPLEHRITIARKMASCLFHLHAVSWLHKAIRSDNVLVFVSKTSSVLDLEQPLLSGFEYARPDREGSTATGTANTGYVDAWDLYRHPEYQGIHAGGNYRKTFDIYSLGIVLVEIAMWQPIHEVLGFETASKVSQEERCTIRSRLLSESEPFGALVSARVGAKFKEAVWTCLRGGEVLGVQAKDNEMNTEVGVRIQRAFTRLVTEPLSSILR